MNRAHHTPERRSSGDKVFTPPWAARNIVSGYGTVREMCGWGGMVEIRWYGTGSKLGFPMGNAIAAFHWRRGHNGDTRQSFFEDASTVTRVQPRGFA